MWSRVYETVGHPLVSLSVPTGTAAMACGRFAAVCPHAGDIDRLLHGAPAVGAVAFHFVSTAANVNSVVFTAT